MLKKTEEKLIEKTINIGRHSRTVKGGKIMSFSALVVVGDGNARIGMGRAKAITAGNAVKKAVAQAKRDLRPVALGAHSIIYPTTINNGPTKLILKPAVRGSGILANKLVRSVFEVLRVTDVVAKTIGSTNPERLLPTIMKGLRNYRPISHFLEKRGLQYEQLFTIKKKKEEANTHE